MLAGGASVDDGFEVEDVGGDAVVEGASVVDELLAAVVFAVDGAPVVLLEFAESVVVGGSVEDPLVLGFSVVVSFPDV